MIRELKVKEPFGSSDHNMTEFTMQFEREKLKSDVTLLHLNKGHYKDMREELARVDWVYHPNLPIEIQCCLFLIISFDFSCFSVIFVK